MQMQMRALVLGRVPAVRARKCGIGLSQGVKGKMRCAGRMMDARLRATDPVAEPVDLYDEIGGREAITAMVDVFYKKVVVDGRVSRWFEGIDMTRQRGKMVNFLTCVTKGKPYERDLTIPHAKMVDAGLDDEAFDVIEELMTTAMKESNLSQSALQFIADAVERTRNGVLGRISS